MGGAVTVRVASIRTDGGTQMRAAINEETVEEYAAKYASGVKLPPPVVFFDGEDHWLADGFHRLAAAERAGMELLGCDERKGTQRDAILFAVGANAKHGLKRTNADKRRAVETLLRDQEWVHWSDHVIADACCVVQETVRSARLRLESTDQISQLTKTVGADGKERKRRTCATCGEPGHTAKTCTQSKEGGEEMPMEEPKPTPAGQPSEQGVDDVIAEVLFCLRKSAESLKETRTSVTNMRKSANNRHRPAEVRMRLMGAFTTELGRACKLMHEAEKIVREQIREV